MCRLKPVLIIKSNSVIFTLSWRNTTGFLLLPGSKSLFLLTKVDLAFAKLNQLFVFLEHNDFQLKTKNADFGNLTCKHQAESVDRAEMVTPLRCSYQR